MRPDRACQDTGRSEVSKQEFRDLERETTQAPGPSLLASSWGGGLRPSAPNVPLGRRFEWRFLEVEAGGFLAERRKVGGHPRPLWSWLVPECVPEVGPARGQVPMENLGGRRGGKS